MSEITRALEEFIDAKKDTFCGCAYIKCERCIRRDAAREWVDMAIESLVKSLVREVREEAE